MSVGSPPRLAVCLIALLGCSDDLRGNGTDCTASAQCESGLCYANLCLDPAGDDDGDGLDNRTEQRLRSHPKRADSDGDGKPDGVEAGSDPGQAPDHDGDGKPDIVESAFADADRDCIPDERDAQDTVPAGDERLVAQQACATAGVCAAAKGAVSATCDHGVLQCHYASVPGWSAVEACDAKDNDCDGQTDEGHTYDGAAVGQPCVGTGQCGKGVVECQAGAAQCSSNPGGSQSQALPETCNGKDDDCDGQTDEAFARDGLQVGKPCLGKGECGVGVVVCGSASEVLCSTEPGGPQAHAAPETCNGKDDDCDGLADDGLLWQGLPVGATCTAAGACGAGVVVCGAKGDPLCSTAAGAPQSKAQPEACNGQDDDCDGQTDEGLQFQGVALGSPCAGKGACGKGTVVCGKAGNATCSTLPDGTDSQAKPEACNGQDDDCDGATDDQVAWQGKPLGAACTGLGTCGAGVVECAKDGQATCSSNGNGSQSQAKPEACNGQDDDCDGQTDESVPPPVLACQAPGVCADAKAKVACLQGTWTCDFSLAPGWQAAEQACDGLDNDCDGLTDEGLLSAWGKPTPPKWDRPAARLNAVHASGGGYLWVAGGKTAALDGSDLKVANDVWRLDPANGSWLRIAVDEGQGLSTEALAWLPPGLAAAGPRLWRIGDSNSGSILHEVDPESGQTVKLPFNFAVSGKAALVATKTAVWLVAPGFVARWTPKEGWTDKVPQTKELGAMEACAAPDGTLYAFHLYANNSFYAYFGYLKPGADAWSPATPPDAVNGRLVCDLAPGQVWLLGVPKGTSTRTLVWKGSQWSDVTAPGDPAVWEPLAGAWQGKLVMALGESPLSVGQPDAFVGLPGSWARIDAAPEAAVGARWLALPGQVVRAGGAWVLPGPITSTTQFQAPAWRYKSGTWTRWPLPPDMPSRAFAAWALEPKGEGLLLWSGVTKPGAPTALLSKDVQQGAPGAVRLDLATGAWTTVEGPVANALPPTKADPAVAPGNAPGSAYLVGAGNQPDSAELWYLDLAKPQSTLLWKTATSPGPAFRPSSSLALDSTYNRLIFAQVASGQLELWAWSLAGGAWQKLAAQATDGYRALLVGASELPDLILLSIPGPGNAKVAAQRVFLGPQPKWEPVAAPASGWPAWQGTLQSVWRSSTQEAWLAGAQIGTQQSAGVIRWPRVCP